MTTKDKAVKIVEELIRIQGSEKLSLEQVAELTKQHYRLSDKEFSGMLMLAMS